MKLFLISQTENDQYDTFDSAVVCAENANQARQMNPATGKPFEDWNDHDWNGWCSSPSLVTVTELGEAKEGTLAGVICASFNAG